MTIVSWFEGILAKSVVLPTSAEAAVVMAGFKTAAFVTGVATTVFGVPSAIAQEAQSLLDALTVAFETYEADTGDTEVHALVMAAIAGVHQFVADQGHVVMGAVAATSATAAAAAAPVPAATNPAPAVVPAATDPAPAVVPAPAA